LLVTTFFPFFFWLSLFLALEVILIVMRGVMLNCQIIFPIDFALSHHS